MARSRRMRRLRSGAGAGPLCAPRSRCSPLRAEAFRGLAPAGVLYLTVPYRNLWRRIIGGWPGGLCLPSGALPAPGFRFQHHVFEGNEIVAAVRAAGFEPAIGRPVSILWGLKSALRLTSREAGGGPSARVAPGRDTRGLLSTAVLRDALVRETPRGPFFGLLLAALRPLVANSYLLIARKRK